MCVQDLILLEGCQSRSTSLIKTVAVQCLPVPKPAAWFMEARAPDLTQRMLNELSASLTPVTKD
ncbi:hypothetical protein VC33_07770 [Pseudomonas fluorescens]|nr:hypothetical protein VC33_07770 [Pseudomonas fluorescens]